MTSLQAIQGRLAAILSIALVVGVITWIIVRSETNRDVLGARVGTSSGESQASIELVDLGADSTLPPNSSGVVLQCRSTDLRPVIRTSVVLTPRDSNLKNGSFISDENGDSARVVLVAGTYDIRQIVGNPLEERFEPIGTTNLPFPVEVPVGRNVALRIQFRPIVTPRVRLELRPMVDDVPLNEDLVMRATAECRGRRIVLHPNSTGGFEGVCDFKTGSPPPTKSNAIFRLEGRGFEDLQIEAEDPGSAVADISTECAIPLLKGSFRGRLVDGETGQPLPRHRFDLSVRQSLANRGNVIETLTTDDNGEFDVTRVRFPCAFSVVPRGGEHYVPEGREMSLVPDGSKIVRVTRIAVGETRLRVAEDIIEHASKYGPSDRVWFEILPLSQLSRRLRVDIAVNKRLTDLAVERLLTDGEVNIGYLPTGKYRISIVIPTVGSFSREISINEESATNTVDVVIGTVDSEIEIDAAAYGVHDGIIIDGYVPATLAQPIHAWLSPHLATRRSEPCVVAMIGDDGTARLSRRDPRNAGVTIIADDGRVIHARVSTGSSTEKGDPPEDGVFCGRVVDKFGHPVAGAAVNLTSVQGGEGLDYEPAPTACELRDIRTDSDGAFVIAGVTPGPYVLSIAELIVNDAARTREFRYLKSAMRIVTVFPSENRPIDVKLDDAAHPCSCGSRHISVPHEHRLESRRSASIEDRRVVERR